MCTVSSLAVESLALRPRQFPLSTRVNWCMYVILVGCFRFFFFLLISKISRNKKHEVGGVCACLLRLFFVFCFLFIFFSKLGVKKYLSLLTYVRYVYVTYVHGETRFALRIASSSIAGSVCCNDVLFFFSFSQQTCPVRDYTLFWSTLSLVFFFRLF